MYFYERIGAITLKFYIRTTQEIIPSSPVLYMRRVGRYGAGNYRLMDTFKTWVKENHLYKEDTVIYAIPMDDPEKAAPCQCRYDVCLPLPQHPNPSFRHMRCRTLEGGSYLVFQIPHTADAVQAAWQGCRFELENLGYLLDDNSPIMERYTKRLVDEHICELCVPIL